MRDRLIHTTRLVFVDLLTKFEAAAAACKQGCTFPDPSQSKAIHHKSEASRGEGGEWPISQSGHALERLFPARQNLQLCRD